MSTKQPNSLFFLLEITQPSGMPFLKTRLTKEQANIISMLLFPNKDKPKLPITYPLNYCTSFAIVDAQGNTVINWFTRKPKTVPLRINKGVWLQYRRYNRTVGLEATDCSIVREFYREYQVFNKQETPTQGTLRYFIETLINLKPATMGFQHLANPKPLQQKSFIDNRKIVICPVIRKKPSNRGLFP